MIAMTVSFSMGRDSSYSTSRRLTRSDSFSAASIIWGTSKQRDHGGRPPRPRGWASDGSRRRSLQVCRPY